MIKIESSSKEWIEAVSKSKKADKILVEKVVRALTLLEGLATSDLEFIFKGGTALMLLLDSSRRLSIDIDIILPDKDKDLDNILEQVCKDYGFTHYKRQVRRENSKIDKDHYMLFFESVVENKESYVLLDVLREDIHYNNIIEVPISGAFIDVSGETVSVKVPDFNNILGDKLTAFAPNTTGIPYRKKDKEMGMEIIKQLYDIACICDHADNPVSISEVFSTFAKTEITYREDKCTVSDVIEDIIDNALEICLRGDYGKANYDILLRGITQVRSFIFSEPFHLEKAITCAAKAAYIVSLIKYEKDKIERYHPRILPELIDWQIKEPMNTKLNKIKKSDREAFFYLYKIWEMQHDSLSK
ncbi:MAG TPA: nucleotidyl transferase AbiEii/AbiGii toxin family protein [Bacteroidales bacterium]|nr:nucleotidyl transferase AbiEii/AbiGii toxin family protein [Bacteroidales bacterium]HRR48822.1 nucleotidyl transferase AbiEii/AbiGii toxin family protein [Bacteroidales bacterium]HRT33312.1 nucleotidyl transferase AbiEii/AbiGii toxin family protein [Bacteroidales bacterium]HRT83388.1 nucleotidyl transferase AbiEii/AbiGii toxin family protein [Bacteroidales bacterium]